MKLANFEIEQLKVLPLRAIVAFAARCARRVEALAQLPEGDPRREQCREAVGAALRMTEAYASGSDAPPDESVIAAVDGSRDVGDQSARSSAADAAAQAAHAAASAWHAGTQAADQGRAPVGQPAKGGSPLAHVTADLAAMNAYTAAAGAFLAVGYHNEDFVGAALNDYATLVSLNLGCYPEPGAPIDPSPAGPLGPL